MVGDLSPNGKSLHELILNLSNLLLLRLSDETIDPLQASTHSSAHSRHLEQTKTLIDVSVDGEGLQLHLGQRFADSDDSFQLPHRDKNHHPLTFNKKDNKRNKKGQ